MRFGETIRRLRKANGLTLRALAEQIGVSYAYISKVERSKLVFGEFPSESLIRKLALAFDADEDWLLLLADKMPDSIRSRVFERPDAFQKIAQLSDQKLDQLIAWIDSVSTVRGASERKKNQRIKPRVRRSVSERV